MRTFIVCGALFLASSLHAQVLPASGLNVAADRVLPAVVRVQSFYSDSLMMRRPQPLRQQVQSGRTTSGDLIGSASGVILSTEGYIMTNAHVLNGGDSLRVILPDRRSYRARLIGTDDAADLALLKIPVTGLAYLELGDPQATNIGDAVLAIGNPLDLTSTVTAGILSARYRRIDDELTLSSINSFLQTDAAINEGMSGSALVDQSGRLIGINAAIVSPSGSFAGYGFAIPANTVAKAFHDLVAYGRVRRGCLEAGFKDMDDAQARRLAASPSGVRVEKVLAKGAADQAGLLQDDVILLIDKEPVTLAAQLREWIANRNPGDRVMLTLQRAGKRLDLPAILAENNDRRDLAERWPAGPAKRVKH